MADITFVQKDVRPLPGAVIRGGYIGETLGVGDLVAVKNDDKYWKADANAPVMPGVGVVVAVGSEGLLSGSAGDRVSIALAGPVAGFTGTSGARIYASDNPGKIADAASATTPQTLGIFLPDDVMLLNITI